jgi:hypothetical protein
VGTPGDPPIAGELIVSEQHRRHEDVPPEHRHNDRDDRRDGASALTPAEQHAMRRSAPLTPNQFEEPRRLAARGINPLPHL